MTIKEFELIKEMLHKQAKLDESIMSAPGLTEIDEASLRMAILDEVGELTHELKGDWCWWKNSAEGSTSCSDEEGVIKFWYSYSVDSIKWNTT